MITACSSDACGITNNPTSRPFHPSPKQQRGPGPECITQLRYSYNLDHVSPAASCSAADIAYLPQGWRKTIDSVPHSGTGRVINALAMDELRANVYRDIRPPQIGWSPWVPSHHGFGLYHRLAFNQLLSCIPGRPRLTRSNDDPRSEEISSMTCRVATLPVLLVPRHACHSIFLQPLVPGGECNKCSLRTVQNTGCRRCQGLLM